MGSVRARRCEGCGDKAVRERAPDLAVHSATIRRSCIEIHQRPKATIPVRTKSRRNSSSAPARSTSAASRTRDRRQLDARPALTDDFARASAQSTKVPQRCSATRRLAPNDELMREPRSSLRATPPDIRASTAIAVTNVRRTTRAYDRESTGFPFALPCQWGAGQAIAKFLLPGEDVSALQSRRIVKGNSARQMHPERDELFASPSNIADGKLGGGPNILHEAKLVFHALQSVMRP